MRKEIIKIELPYWRLVELNIRQVNDIIERFEYLIVNRVVLHNDQLDIDFIVEEICVHECIEKASKELEIVIYILDDIDKDIQKSLDTLKESLGELLPTKRRENRGAKEISTLK